MAAMPNEIDWRDVLTGEIRAIQSYYPQAHEALKDWGLWSRWRLSLYPRLARSSIWHLGPSPKQEDFADDGEQGAGVVPQLEVKAEAAPVERFSERLAVEIDIRVHQDNFPPIWRRCVKAGYVYRLPEYQWPQNARCGNQGFVMFLDAALNRIQRAMEG